MRRAVLHRGSHLMRAVELVKHTTGVHVISMFLASDMARFQYHTQKTNVDKTTYRPHSPTSHKWVVDQKKKKWPRDQIKKMWDNNSHQGGFIHSDQEQVKEKSFKIHFATTWQLSCSSKEVKLINTNYPDVFHHILVNYYNGEEKWDVGGMIVDIHKLKSLLCSTPGLSLLLLWGQCNGDQMNRV